MLKQLNKDGFTLIEMLAVVVILGVITAIMVPTVTTLIFKSKEDNYKNLEKSILSAAKVYISDNRYNITLENEECDNYKQRNIKEVNEIKLTHSRLTIKNLVETGNLTTNSNNKILNPKDDNQILKVNDSYVIVKYNCDKKDYDFIEFAENCNDENKSCLKWE